MKILPIFVKKNKQEGLFSILLPNEIESELDKCLTQWMSTEYLFNFFTKNEGDLNNGYYGKNISISQAVSSTREEAFNLFEKLSALATSEADEDKQTLSIAFQPLRDGNFTQKELQEEKAKTKVNLRCLRIYAIKISPNTYIVTGGSIKLVGEMDKRKHLKQEKQKLYEIRDFLIDNGIIDQEDFEAYEI